MLIVNFEGFRIQGGVLHCHSLDSRKISPCVGLWKTFLYLGGHIQTNWFPIELRIPEVLVPYCDWIL